MEKHDSHAMHDRHEHHDPHAGHGGLHGGAPAMGHDEPPRHKAMAKGVHHRDIGAAHPAEHAEHRAHVDHTGHEQMFRQRFGVSLALSIPVLLYSPMIQRWLGFTMPAFPGSEWITPIFSVIVFFYGGLPFLRMAVPELQNRQPGMMTLISLAISVAFVYSLAALILPSGEGFFWELVTLVDVMLLGHWIEMRSVRQASRALDELARLMPDTAERIHPDGSTRRSRSAAWRWAISCSYAPAPVSRRTAWWRRANRR